MLATQQSVNSGKTDSTRNPNQIILLLLIPILFLKPLVQQRFTANALGASEGRLNRHKNRKVSAMYALRVHVREYIRFRNGRRERVRKHTRRWPHQYRFQF